MLMEVDLSLPDWGGRSASPLTAGGGRAAIQRRMKSIAHRLANWPVGAHVRGANNSFLLLLPPCYCCYYYYNLGEPTHTLVSCWMPKTLSPRNKCTGWFTPALLLPLPIVVILWWSLHIYGDHADCVGVCNHNCVVARGLMSGSDQNYSISSAISKQVTGISHNVTYEYGGEVSKWSLGSWT